MKIFRNTAIFIIVYLFGMLPTYILPYFGSNSLIISAVAAVVGFGLSPQTWAHLWSLAFLIAITWARGPFAGRSYLVVFPVLAAAFDMVPFLSMIPFVPTIMHILAIVLGAIVKTPASEEVCLASCKKALYMLLAVTFIAVAGTILFVATAGHRAATAKQQGIEALDTSAGESSSASSMASSSSSPTKPQQESSASSSTAAAETSAHSEASSSAQASSSADSSAASSKSSKSQPKVAASRKSEHVDHSRATADKKRLQKTNDMLDDLLKN